MYLCQLYALDFLLTALVNLCSWPALVWGLFLLPVMVLKDTPRLLFIKGLFQVNLPNLREAFSLDFFLLFQFLPLQFDLRGKVDLLAPSRRLWSVNCRMNEALGHWAAECPEDRGCALGSQGSGSFPLVW